MSILTPHARALPKTHSDPNPRGRAQVDELAARLYRQYPRDVGVFCAYLLNYVTLSPGEALCEPTPYAATPLPHAQRTRRHIYAVRVGLCSYIRKSLKLCRTREAPPTLSLLLHAWLPLALLPLAAHA
eukprot:80709-Prymnesium_polylepis.3